MNIFLRDLLYSVRVLGKNWTFAFVAVLTLTLGIGANTAIFSTVSALLLHPYPFTNLDQVVLLEEVDAQRGRDVTRATPADYLDLQTEARNFEQVGAFRYTNMSLTRNGEVDAVEGVNVSANFFDLLGARPLLGRTFLPDEEQQGHDRVAVLTERLWRRKFGADPGLIGQTIQLNNRSCTVVGILPAKFFYPLGMDVWVPLTLSPGDQTDRVSRVLHPVGGLRAGVTLAQAREELKSISAGIEKRFPQTNQGRSFTLLRLREEQYEYTAPLFLMLQAAAIFVLLLAGANLANLLFVRAIGRQKELAIRTALGASRNRLAQLLVCETMLLALLAGAAATAISYWGVGIIRNGMPVGISMWVAGWNDIQLDSNVLSFTLILTVLTGIFFGLASAFHASRVSLSDTLKESGRGTMGSAGKNRLRSTLVVAQVSLAFILLVGAGLLIKGFVNVARVYQGLDPANVLTVRIGLPESDYANTAKAADFFERVLQGIANSPGVRMASAAANIPASNVDNEKTQFTIEGRPAISASETPSADLQVCSADFLRTLRIPLLTGRGLSNQDGRDSPRVAVISHAMANRNWPGQDPIGHRIRIGNERDAAPWVTIIGVVSDIKQNWYEPVVRPIIYLPLLQVPRRSMNLLVRASGDPLLVASAVREAVHAADHQIPLTDVQPLPDVISDSLAPIRIIGILMAVFGGVALVLAAVGVYGILSHSVAQRTHEIGVRMALGAAPREVLRMILGQALKLSGIALAIALPVSIALSYVMARFIFGLVALHLEILIGLALVLLGVSAAAAYLPARRAMRVDPVVALFLMASVVF